MCLCGCGACGAELGGDYRTFIDRMNKRAKELGCTDTHFNNCNGLPDEDHWGQRV